MLTPILIGGSFLCNSYQVVLLITRHYPSNEISPTFSKIFYITITILAIFQFFMILGFISSLTNDDKIQRNSNDSQALFEEVFLIGLGVIVVQQIFNSIGGAILIKNIRRKRRKELLESF
jgi:cellulose synthase/poly-beta-1,6-N-acetylglucosamine synthase-like glycosyltransferase